MKALINQFTKNLSGCSGCGKSDEVYETWVKAKQLGVRMKFQFSVVIDASTYKEAITKVPDEFEILSGSLKPEPKPPVDPQKVVHGVSGLPVNG